jgi:hypothetical protein
VKTSSHAMGFREKDGVLSSAPVVVRCCGEGKFTFPAAVADTRYRRGRGPSNYGIFACNCYSQCHMNINRPSGPES